jgi:hypothetical protein
MENHAFFFFDGILWEYWKKTGNYYHHWEYFLGISCKFTDLMGFLMGNRREPIPVRYQWIETDGNEPSGVIIAVAGKYPN